MLNLNDLRISAHYQQHLVVPQLHIGAGTKILLIGGNAEGKSILTKVIQGLYKDYTGEISLHKNAKSTHHPSSLLVELLPHLMKSLTVWQNLVLPFRKISMYTEDQIKDLAQRVEIERYFETKGAELSYSAAKMTELVRAAVVQPYLLILDDFDKFFDEAHFQKAMILLQHLTNSGCSVLATSQKTIPGFDAQYQIVRGQVVAL